MIYYLQLILYNISRLMKVINYVLTEYVEEMFQTFISATKDDLKEASISLKESTPVAMNTMLAKQPKEAIKKREEKKMVVKASSQSKGTNL